MKTEEEVMTMLEKASNDIEKILCIEPSAEIQAEGYDHYLKKEE